MPARGLLRVHTEEETQAEYPVPEAAGSAHRETRLGVLPESGGCGPAAASGRARARTVRTVLSCRHYTDQPGFPGCLLPTCILKFGFRPERFGFVLFTITAFSPRPLSYQLMSLGLVKVMEQRPGDNCMTHIFAERINFL